ncbi:von Willebrand factor A domain-containing protein 7-like [Haliotis cracherodii]|uniref:von Willebrand factor A domain-containing protein 7-like n=1 Tax=Haliotis cracherodii TaxID=6455 RepID=UPI0039E755FC
MSMLLVCMLFLGGVDAFLPNRLYDGDIGHGTLTHEDITRIGIVKAVASFFDDNPRNGSTPLRPGHFARTPELTARILFPMYYGVGASEKRLVQVIADISSANNRVDQDHYGKAVWHFHGELIHEAHSKMISIRELILGMLKRDNPNLDAVKELIGQFLHMLQMFYSNTNWVEMKGGVPYFQLGIKDKPIYIQALSSMDTCKTCGQNAYDGCENTLLVKSNILTSGYRSGEDITKPSRDPLAYTGKCSHGGPRDNSATTTAALGGINKDSTEPSLSPHHHLHLQAAQAAIHHTIHFFNDKVDGIRGHISKHGYENLLQLKSGNSLAFVIDTTGSMADDIEAVKNAVINITASTVGTVDEPANYIVVLFNDPAQLTETHQFEDGQKTISFLKSITVHGGGDCPEYSMDGLLKALEICLPSSKIFVATDASPKDAEMQSTVASLALQKKITVDFFLTGRCTRRRRDAEVPLYKRAVPDGGSIYDMIAGASGGSVHTTTKAGIGKVAQIIQESVSPLLVTLMKVYMPSSQTTSTIYVDDTITEVTVKIMSRGGSEPQQTITAPGAAVTTNVTVDYLGGGIKLVKLQKPTPGEWTLTRSDSYEWDVEVTAESSFDIFTTFVKTDPSSGFQYEIQGRPIAGDDVTIVATGSSMDSIQSLSEVLYLADDGSELARHPGLTRVPGSADSAVFKLRITLPTTPFKVAVWGRDKSGHQLIRLQPSQIVPVAIDLKMLPAEGVVYLNEKMKIPFMVTNKGGSQSVINVTIKDDQNFAQTPFSLVFTLNSGESKTGEFIIMAGPTEGITTTITLTATTGDAGDFQYGVKRVSTGTKIPQLKDTDKDKPECHITSLVGTCDENMLEPCTCHQDTWSASAEIWDEGTGLFQITSSMDETGSFEVGTFVEGQTGVNGSVQTSIRGSCCTSLVHIIVVDVAGNTGECQIDLAPGLHRPVYDCVPSEQQDAERDFTGVIVGCCVGGVALFFAVATAVVMKICHKAPVKKV